MSPTRPDQDSTTLVMSAVRGLMVFLVPLAGVVGAYYSTKASLESDIRAIAQRVDFDQRTTDGDLAKLQADLDDLREDLDRHAALGVGGLPHPAGLMVELERMSERVKRLENKVMP